MLKNIRESTNTVIRVPDKDSASEMICVIGDQENVMKAVQMIREKVCIVLFPSPSSSVPCGT